MRDGPRRPGVSACLPWLSQHETASQCSQTLRFIPSFAVPLGEKKNLVITRLFLHSTLMQTPSGAEALGFSAANCYTIDMTRPVVTSGESPDSELGLHSTLDDHNRYV